MERRHPKHLHQREVWPSGTRVSFMGIPGTVSRCYGDGWTVIDFDDGNQRAPFFRCTQLTRLKEPRRLYEGDGVWR
jgi:hypothetical protein